MAASALIFDPARHEALAAPAWDAATAARTIAVIADDVQAACLDGTAWPVHPLDADGDTPAGGFKGLYLGSAGVWWSLWSLARRGLATLRLDARDGIERTLAAYRDAPDSGAVVPSYFLGEVGVLLVHWRLTGAEASAAALAEGIERNITNPTLEALWGAPGTMLAAWHMARWTGAPHWRDLFLRNVDALWQAWERHDDVGAWLWTQDLYGRRPRLLGAGHGFVGNVYALLRESGWLDDARRDTLHARCAETLAATVIESDGACNWLPDVGPQRQPGRPPPMQWCHGAPGIVTATADVPVGASPRLDTMLRQAGEAVWRAGPLAKGHGLCHGTAGNGYAFLKLHRRTGGALWLDRARQFAMHAIGQYDRMRAAHGTGRYSLWTGDPGLAHYLADCIAVRDAWPSLDTLD